jgi:hypothetical protein
MMAGRVLYTLPADCAKYQPFVISAALSLKAPLGGRVLVDEKGDVGSVCPEIGSC